MNPAINCKIPALRYHGSKWRAADKIIPLFPKHFRYVEPFGGSAALLLQKAPSQHEIYNDLDQRVSNLFFVLRDHGDELREKLENTPYSRIEFNLAHQEHDDPVEDARRVVVLSCMGFSSDSSTRKGNSGFRSHVDNINTYSRGFHHLEQIKERLKKVVIESLDASVIIDKYDSPETLFYIDPPYLLSTRNNAGGGYQHELTEQEHIDLAKQIQNIKGMCIVSGYQSELYSDLYQGWTEFSFTSRAQTKSGPTIKTEMLWLSPGINQFQLQLVS